jgi:hypothetical protein
MPIVMTAEIPASADMYDAINKEMGVSGESLPKGLIAHYAAPTDNGMLIFDVWETRADFEDFAATMLGPAMEKVTGSSGEGIKPTVADLYNSFEAG